MSQPELRGELLELRERDQIMRRTIGERYDNPDAISPADQEWWLRVDSENTARMRAIVDQVGWPGVAMVGEDGAEAAWLLVLHADQNPAFQRRCLKLLEQAVADGQAQAVQLAELTDRLCVNARQRQVYGTQMHMAHGQIVPWPIEAPGRVDERRAQVGLPPLDTYMQQVRRQYGE
jgi:hypothetical protein